MWNPERNKRKEALSIIKDHAYRSISKELIKINKKVDSQSDKLKNMMNKTLRSRGVARSNLSLLCEERDRYELALQILKEDENESNY